jgi:predicted Zn-dependent peptidase
VIAGAVLAVAIAAASPAYESQGTLQGGGSYVVHHSLGARTTAMELWFRAPSDGYDGAYPGISRLAVTALAASSPPHGTSLSELVSRLGGTFSINVYPDIVSVAASVPSWEAQDVLRVLTSAYFDPSISPDGLKAALRDTAVTSAETKFDPQRMMQDALFADLFASGPAHVAPTPYDAEEFAKIPQSALDAFARRAFRQNNAVLVLTGDASTGLLAGVHSGNAGAPMDAPIDSRISSAPRSVTQPADEAGIGYAWAGAPISDTRAATALDFLADYLFDEEQGTVSRAIRSISSDAYVGGQFITLHDPGVLLAFVSGADSPAIREQLANAVTAVQTPMDAKSFEAARAAFEYRIFAQTQTPPEIADSFGWYAAEGNAEYAPGSASQQYLQAVQSLTPAYVAQIARTYLQHPAIVQMLERGDQGAST